jgi:hypothetical protein
VHNEARHWRQAHRRRAWLLRSGKRRRSSAHEQDKHRKRKHWHKEECDPAANVIARAEGVGLSDAEGDDDDDESSDEDVDSDKWAARLPPRLLIKGGAIV